MRRTRSWHVDAPPDRLWRVLADTARFNEASGLGKYQLEELPQADGSVLRIGRSRIMGFGLEWNERPYEWLEGSHFRQTRLFRKGPFSRFGISAELTPEASGRTRIDYVLHGEPANIFGHALVALRQIDRAFRHMGMLVETASRHAEAGEPGPAPFEMPTVELAPGGRERLEAARGRLAAGPYGHGLADRLATLIAGAPDVDVEQIRPLKLARDWGVSRLAAVELALAATREGMLRLSWDLLCPRCRGAKRSVAALDQLPRGAHCPSCNIDYGADFTENVELSFRPAPSIRPVLAGGFCIAGPMSTPHVVMQQILAPGETRDLAAPLPPGRYRLRTIDPGETAEFEHDGGALPAFVADASGARLDAVGPAIRLANRDARERVLVLERRDWRSDALTAKAATALQAFRDLFADQVLRPDEDVAIDSVALMFTDLEGSTALYQRIGDGAAYNLVRDHFAYLGEAVRRHEGTLVKTIGDAVMAAFADPAQAVAAALSVQRHVGEFNARQQDAAIRIKTGLHVGPCIAVTMNGRLDYFGSAVNLAARLQGESGGGDVVISEALAADPAVRPLLAPFRLSDERARLKGFAEPVPFHRLTQDALLAN